MGSEGFGAVASRFFVVTHLVDICGVILHVSASTLTLKMFEVKKYTKSKKNKCQTLKYVYLSHFRYLCQVLVYNIMSFRG